jgi:hypothetical protein
MGNNACLVSLNEVLVDVDCDDKHDTAATPPKIEASS